MCRRCEEQTMRSVSQSIYPSLIALMLIAASSPANARRCDTLLPDGQVVSSGAAVDEHGRACDEFFAGRRELQPDDFLRHEFKFRQITRPRIGFTTGNIGPFTTGDIGPFTTFSNSPPAARRRR
jgi:hypothetical protein